jgi:two-component system chemotaxis response regulator CheB
MSNASARRPRVLVCEDSRTFAAALTRVLEHESEFEVVGVSETAEDVLRRLPELRPDLVTMDIELPGMSGLEAVEQIMSVQPVPIVVLSSLSGVHTSHAAAALAAGALDAFAKDDVDLSDPGGTSARAFRRRLAVLSGARVIRHPRARLRTERPSNARGPRATRAIGICSSTGGPQALATILGDLPGSFPIPILVAQHITAGFAEGLAAWLDAAVALPVKLAGSDVVASPGVWLAPDDAHLELGASGLLTLDRVTAPSPHRPSGDVLLRSLAATAGTEAVSIVLTGMGRDGAQGSHAVREAGGLTIAQDESTSVIFGMPQAAAALGVDLVLPLGDIAPQLRALVAERVAI